MRKISLSRSNAILPFLPGKAASAAPAAARDATPHTSDTTKNCHAFTMNDPLLPVRVRRGGERRRPPRPPPLRGWRGAPPSPPAPPPPPRGDERGGPPRPGARGELLSSPRPPRGPA